MITNLKTRYLLTATAVLSGFSYQCIFPQQEPSHSSIEYRNHQTFLRAQDPRPLNQALSALALEYGWMIDYEDPIYSPIESKDVTNPLWRREHPAEAGLLIPSGRDFDARLGAAENIKERETEVLERLVEQYNHTANPGLFRLIILPNGQIVVSGKSRVSNKLWNDEIFDMKITPMKDKRSAMDALQGAVNQCASASKIPVVLGLLPVNILKQAPDSGSNAQVSCRVEILRVLSELPKVFTYQLLYDISSKSYFLSVVPLDKQAATP